MSSRSQLNASINAFGLELRSFVQRASDSITSLKRTAEQRPQAGVHDFKECLDDLEQQVADFTDEVQQLAEYTTGSISFEELIGHCSAVYRVNRATVLSLEAHLGQYGYQRPLNAVQEPEGLQECLLDNTDDDLIMCSTRTRQVWSTPTSPVSKGSLLTGRTAGDRPLPSRLGRSQPSSPTAAFSAAATASKGETLFAGNTSQLRGATPPSTLHALASTAGMRMPLTQLRQQQQQRTSLGSNTSATPAGLLISPGVAALASKYATSSVGGSSVGALSLPEQQSTGGFSTDDRNGKSTCRDLNLSYGTLSDAASPDLPIFGRTALVTPIGDTPAAAAAGQRWQQEQCETPAGRQQQQQQQQRGRSSGEDSTGELYSSLIHSNIHGMDRRVADAGTGDMDVTPPCTSTGVSPCSSPQAPPTAGRLPPDWVTEKMQQLEDLQADVTLTLSQMKRCPSRSRTAPTSAAGSEDDSSSDEEEDQPSRKPARQQQRPRSAELLLHDSSAHAAHTATTQPAAAAAAAAAAGQAALQTACQPAQQERSARPTGTAVTASSRAAAAGPNQYGSSTAANSLTAAAAAASADLETLMASLSMKYALSDNTAPPAAAAGGAAGVDEASGMDVDSQPNSPSWTSLDAGSSPVPAAGAADDYRGHAAPPVHLSTQQQQQQEAEGEYAGAGGCSSLSPTTVQAMSRVAALGGTAVRPQSISRRMQPAADVHRLEDIRGFYLDQGSTLPQSAAVDSTAGVHSGLPAKFTSTGSSRNSSSSSLQAAAGAEREHAVLQPVQLQEQSTAAGPAAPVKGGPRQSRQLLLLQQHDKPKQQQATPQQQQPGETLTPRAARLQRRLQQQRGQQQQQPSDAGTDQENTCPASSNTAHTAAAAAGGAGDDCGAVVTVRDISCDEFGQLPSWCKSLLSVELLNGVLQELAELSSGRSKLGAVVERQPTNGFTADDVATLGHSSSKSKTIVSCLHKLGRATLQRSVAGGNVYKLVSSS